MNEAEQNKLDRELSTRRWAARSGALCYSAWAMFHLKVAFDIMKLGQAQDGLVQGRLFQLAAYMLSISVAVLVAALWRNWRNDRSGYWFSLCLAGWADGIWVLVVVLPGYVGFARGFVPPAIFLAGAFLTTIARLPRSSGARTEALRADLRAQGGARGAD